ncbi:hypothetical protein [Aquirufa nivalisilvae]|uniref:hypothetical protein n=1 Tax=Aquirufa nivalisilvae TaxID=2516557 RepID=UPI0022A96EDC|nr:hypothetical protein [Aquirufa nivalisilvae]
MELVRELIDKSSFGEEIFYYAEPETIKLFKGVVSEEEYNVIFPVLKSIIEVEHKLSRR